MSAAAWLGLLLMGAVAEYRPDAVLVAEFDAASYSHANGENGPQVFPYRLHRPLKKIPGLRYPLILWLHGARERGDDNLEQLRWMELVFEALPPEEFDYFILAVQCPPDEVSWYHSPLGGNRDGEIDTMTIAMKVLDRIVANEPVDEDRIYASGVSGGGTACWEIALRFPDRFAAIVPMAAGGADAKRLSAIKHIPVWAFYSLHDEGSDAIRHSVGQLTALGGSAHLTLVDNAQHGIRSVLYEHDCWTGAIKHYDAMQWTLKQNRGAMFSLPPGVRPVPWWNFVALGATFLIGAFAWKIEKRRRAAIAKTNIMGTDVASSSQLEDPCGDADESISVASTNPTNYPETY